MSNENDSPADLIDAKIEELGDWRGGTLSKVRALTHDALPDVEEDIKWRKKTNPLGVPVWSSDGILFTGETYKDKVKLTFFNGSAIDDPTGLFNAGLDGSRHAIDLFEGDEVNEDAFKALVRSAAEVNAK